MCDQQATQRQFNPFSPKSFQLKGGGIKPLFSTNQNSFELVFDLCLCCQITNSPPPRPGCCIEGVGAGNRGGGAGNREESGGQREAATGQCPSASWPGISPFSHSRVGRLFAWPPLRLLGICGGRSHASFVYTSVCIVFVL